MNNISLTGVHKQRLVALVVAVVLVIYIISKLYLNSGIYLPTEMSKTAPYISTSSLRFKARQFYLKNIPLRIISGSMHYFRVVPEYWEDRMLKMKACGLNTLTTYVSWNLHEEYPGQFNFDWMLNIRQYIQLAQKVGLYVILRPGPYICSEWDLGGLPAWLLRDPNMKLRSNYEPYMEAVDRFMEKLFAEIVDLQYSKGGPIIALQVENEFGSYSNEVDHLWFIKSTMVKYGANELFLTSDGFVKKDIVGMVHAPFFNEAYVTANFQNFKSGRLLFDLIKKISPDFPLMVMEFWDGWFDHWGKNHTSLSTSLTSGNLTEILEYGGSVNFYMFHGGTNFGFMAGANYFPDTGYKSDTTSYDYDGPLNEAGDTTAKYHQIREVIEKHVPGTNTFPDIPPDIPKFKYDDVKIKQYFPFEDMLSEVEKSFTIETADLQSMEMLNLYGNYGQNFGYILYRNYVNDRIGNGDVLKFSSTPKDRVQVFLNGHSVCESDWWVPGGTLKLKTDSVTVSGSNQLDLLVENHGRVNFVRLGSYRFEEEKKGISGQVELNGKRLKNWKVFPLDFRKPFMEKIEKSSKWKDVPNAATSFNVPALFQSTLSIVGQPRDTFIRMEGWDKGLVFINGFNLGRYWRRGPQQTLYLPAPLLHSGDNSIMVFEHSKHGSQISFRDKPILNQL